MILIQTLVSFKAQKQGFVINRKKTNNVIQPKSMDTQRKKRWYSLTWPTEHKEVKLKIIKGGWDKKKLVGTEK